MRNARCMVRILAVVLSVGISAQAHAETDWPIYAYWSFDADTIQGKTVRDLGPHNFDGKIGTAGGPKVQFVEGVKGNAVSFGKDNRSWIEITSPKRRPFTLKPPFTIVAWANPQARGQCELLSQKGDMWDEGFRFTYSKQQVEAKCSDGSKRIVVQPDVMPTAGNHWTFVAVVHDGRTITIYMDGEPVVSERLKRPMEPSQRTAMIGNYPDADNSYADAYPFIGLIDELVVLEAALNQKQLVHFGATVLAR